MKLIFPEVLAKKVFCGSTSSPRTARRDLIRTGKNNNFNSNPFALSLSKGNLQAFVIASSIIATFLLIVPSFGLAETKEIIAEGTYNMGDGETPTVAESRALLQAKRTAVEEAGTYVESYSKTRNFQLTVDEIQVLASGVMEVEVLEKKRKVVGDGFNFWIKIKARVSTDKMEEMAKRVKEKSVVEDYKKIQEAYDKSQKEIEELKRQLAGAKGGKKKQVEEKIADDERLLKANAWFEIGYKHSLKYEWDAAIEAYTRGIALNPNDAEAYHDLGRAYSCHPFPSMSVLVFNTCKDKLERSIENYNKAIALNPNLTLVYNDLGNAYSYKGDIVMATINWKKACDMGDIAGCFNLQTALENR